ncbi:MAG: COX15/CtaA family protein [Nitriliruptorales bacterium]|nr:COX15/CtaA family protein [Nitriliruptorales bacterium]
MSPAARPVLRRLSLAAIVVNVGIVVTGGIVRITGSGLGCPDWPTCDGRRVVPAAAEADWHTAIEFGNRLMTFLVLAVVVWLFFEARRRATDRQVRLLALLLPVGVLAQAVLGGITVLTGLHPLTVAAHFLLSMVLIAVAVVLYVRVSRPRGDAPRSDPRLRRLVTGTLVVAAVVLVLGTLVTASGPHAGDPGTVRLGLDIRVIARLHSTAVWGVVALTALSYFQAQASDHDQVKRAALWLLVVEVAQGAVGYTQYALGIPAPLVAVHVFLAALFWVAAVRMGALALGSPAVGADAPTSSTRVGV